VRFPRGRVTANGQQFSFERFQVVQNHHNAAATFDIMIPLFAPNPQDWTWWARETDIEVEISVGFADPKSGQVASWTSLIVGPVEGIAMAPLAYGPHSSLAMRARTEIGRVGMLPHEDSPPHPEGAVLQVRGRDYAGQLIDSQVNAQYEAGTLTSSDVAQQIVGQVPQLTLDLSAAGDGIGDPINSLQGRTILHRSAWDTLCALAAHEGCRVRVKGRTVYFTQLQASDASGAYKIWYIPAKDGKGPWSNCKTLRMARALSLAKGIDQFVHSYDSATGRKASRAVAKVRSSSRASRSTEGQATSYQSFSHNIPGMTQEQVMKHATNRAGELAKFERDIEFQVPGDPSLTVDGTITLSGTGTDFDQSYDVDQITHTYEMARGYDMEVRGKNMSKDVNISTEDIS